MRGARRAYFLCISLFMMGGAKQCEFSVAHWSIEMGSRSILLREDQDLWSPLELSSPLSLDLSPPQESSGHPRSFELRDGDAKKKPWYRRTQKT